jgi:prolyl-tRNA synthetase
VGRTVAAALEQHHDENGIIFPVAITPYHVIVVPINVNEALVMETASGIYEALLARGMEALLDDRDVRPGVKFKDADLIGVPYRITVGAKDLKNGVVEVKERASGRIDKIPQQGIVDYCQEILEAKGVIFDRTNI